MARLRSAESAHTLRLRLVTSAAAAAIILIGSVLFYVIRSANRTSAAAEAGAAIANMIEQGELEQAEGFLARLEKADAALLKYPPVIEARQARRTQRQGERTDCGVRQGLARLGAGLARAAESPRDRSSTQGRAASDRKGRGRRAPPASCRRPGPGTRQARNSGESAAGRNRAQGGRARAQVRRECARPG